MILDSTKLKLDLLLGEVYDVQVKSGTFIAVIRHLLEGQPVAKNRMTTLNSFLELAEHFAEVKLEKMAMDIQDCLNDVVNANENLTANNSPEQKSA